MSTPPTGESAVEPRAQTLRFQGLANRIARGLLSTPLVNRAVGRWLVTVYFVGRKSGRRFSLPVSYMSYEGSLLIGTPFSWGRNLRTGVPVEVLLKGKRRPADVQAFTDEATVVDLFGKMAQDNRQFASFNKIGMDADGNPDPNDLHHAWAAGARAILLTPR